MDKNSIRNNNTDGTQRREVEVNQNTNSTEEFKKQFFDQHLERVKGKLRIKEGEYDDVTKTALTTELRRRNTESYATKLATENARLHTQLELLQNKVSSDFIPKDTPIVDENLKYTDVDEFVKQTLEANNTNTSQQVFQEVQQQAQAVTQQQAVDLAVATHNQKHPDRQITPQLLAMDLEVDPDLTDSLSRGEITTEEYLDVISTNIYSINTVDNTNEHNEPNLSSVGGANTPDTSSNYGATTIF